jgi:hypothetical protein
MSELATHFAETVKTEVEPGRVKLNSYDGKMKLYSEEDIALRLGWRVEGVQSTLVDAKA